MPRHLWSCHKEEREVVDITSETDRSARNNLLLKIHNVGRHNCKVLREGEGVLIVAYRPNHKADPHDYGPCIYCFGYYVRSDLWRHRCPMKPVLNANTDGGCMASCRRGRVVHKSDLLKPPPVGVSFKLNKVLSPMKRDDISLIVKTDSLIIEVAKREYLKLGHDGQHRPWTVEEKRDVMEGLQRFFLMKKLPGKRDIETACPVALATRTWRNIKDFCKNTMKLYQR